jgi:2-polyprenyl-3-methyl-5-hydroxy-6-metoxy-1,4-benzoquinol methylase
LEMSRILVQWKAEEHIKNNNPLGWFEDVYASAGGDELIIPWASLSPNSFMRDWLDEHPFPRGKKALVVGCGLGDDAEDLDRRGFKVTAFDISPTAIQWSRKRFPKSRVSYETVDLFKAPDSWKKSYDFVWEAYTLQSLQSPLREKAIEAMAGWVAVKGILLAVTRGKENEEAPEGPPWPLTMKQMELFSLSGLKIREFKDFKDPDAPAIRRFLGCYQKEA